MRHERLRAGIELMSCGFDARKLTAHSFLTDPFYLPKVAGRNLSVEDRNKLFDEAEKQATALVWGLIEKRLFQTGEEKQPWYWIRHPGYSCMNGVKQGVLGRVMTTIGSFIRPCCEAILFVDDSCTMGVFHPATPLELATLMREKSTPAFDVVKWIIDYEDGKIPRGGVVVGQDAENTCPKCGGFLWSGATRATVFYSCEKCGYQRKEDNLTNPCPR